jgi:putative MATE family efflux protein
MLEIIKKFYSVKDMVKEKDIIGEIPNTKQVYKRAFDVAWPSATESVLIGLVGAIDTMMVGVLGTGAVAAVGITNQPKFILLAIFMSLNVGVTAIVARRRGQKDREGANKCLRQAFLIAVILGAILSAVGVIFAKPMLQLAGANNEIINDAVAYFRVISIGNFFTAITMTINAAQRGAGNTKISMTTNLVANLVNVVFNFLLINGHLGFPKLGVTGAAIATALGNLIALFMSIRSVRNADGFLHIEFKANWKFDKETMKSLTNITSSSFVEQICMRVGFLLTTMIIASLGTVAFATHIICMNIVSLSFTFGEGLGVGASSLVGQNLGAKRPDMATIYSKAIQRIALTIGFILLLLFVFGRYFLVDLFTDDLAVIQTGATILIVIAFMSPLQTVTVVVGGTLRGAGDTKFVAYSSLISIGIIRPFTTWLFCYPLGFGIIGAWYSFMTDQLLRLIINSLRFRTGRWAKIKI